MFGQVLELGIVVHSVIIGISLGASQSVDTIRPLLAALSFHQFFEGMGLNARPLEEAGAAKIIEQPQFNADAVAELLASWDRPALLAMAEKARAVAIPDATDRVAAELIDAAR